MIDDILRDELDAIDIEVRRRKAARLPVPYAAWAMAERMAAVERQHQRETAPAKTTLPRSETP